MASDVEKKFKEYEMEKIFETRKYLYHHPKLDTLFLELTSKCNAHCEHCGSSCDENEQGKEIETKYLKKVLKDVADRYDPHTVMLAVTGGEPLLRKDFFELMHYAHDLGFPWGITSNGTLITKNIAKKLEDAHMGSVSISIDGLKETHEAFRKIPGLFDKIIDGIRYLNESKVIQHVQVTTVVNKKNIHELEDLYQFLLEVGVKNWRVVNCDPIGRANDNNDILLDLEDYKYIFKFIQEKAKEGKMEDVTYGCSHYLGPNLELQIRKHYFICGAGIFVGSVLSNGDIFVCPNVPRRKELIQGNVRKDNFVDVWENKFQAFRNEYRTCNETCLKCDHWNYCGGDAFHTWDFDKQEPGICLRDIFDEI